jgi:hypothetical protein
MSEPTLDMLDLPQQEPYMPDMNREPVVVPLVFNADLNTETVSNILLIDSNMSESQLFYDSANEHTFPIIYSNGSNKTELLQLLKDKFTAVDRISFAFHDNIHDGKTFVDNELFFSETDISDDADAFSPNVSFLLDVIKDFSVKNIDFLACNSLNFANWTKFYNLLQVKTNVVVGASNDATGNLKYGGDWIMENTNEDVVNIYFNSNIENYSSLLTSTISKNGGTLYLRQDASSNIQYSVNNILWSTFSSWPVTIVNSNPSSSNVLTVLSTTDITINNATKYFITGSNYITYDGSNNDFIMDVESYGGLFGNGTLDNKNDSTRYNNITVRNIHTRSTITNNLITDDGAWICRARFSGNNSLIENCTNSVNTTSNSNANSGGSGIAGAYCGQYATNFIVNNCTNSGIMSYGGGGMCGQYAGYGAPLMTISNCSNSGNGHIYSGGICGNASGASPGANLIITNCQNSGVALTNHFGGIIGVTSAYARGYVKIINCTNSGEIIGSNSGGICASGSGSANGTLEIENCSNSGNLSQNYSGGITAAFTGYGGSVNITNCTNSGAVFGYSGGICGGQAGSIGIGIVTITNCSNSGSISIGAGGICGAFAGSANGTVKITNCSNSGNITGLNAGGIVGVGFKGNVIDKCINTGTISGPECGGIIGGSLGLDVNKSIIVKNSYSTGNVTGGGSGGICGAWTGQVQAYYNTPTVLILNCYSLGAVSATCGGIIGGGSPVGDNFKNSKVTIKNCYSYGAIADLSYGIISVYYPYTLKVENCYIANNSWTDAAAKAQLLEFPTSVLANNPGTTWTSIEADTPYILSAFNSAVYSPSSVTVDPSATVTTYTTGNGLFDSDYSYELMAVNNAAPTGDATIGSNGALSLSNLVTRSYASEVFVSKGTAPLYSNYNYSTFALSNICFPAKTPVQTDQGLVNIDQLNPEVHTIRNKKIVTVTKTVTQDKNLICFEKDALGANVPSQKTLMTKNHEVFYKGKMTKAKDFVGLVDNVYPKKYTGEVLYNVLMEEHDKMMINNLICETLHPKNRIAKLYEALAKMTPEKQASFIKKFNEAVENEDEIKKNILTSKK